MDATVNILKLMEFEKDRCNAGIAEFQAQIAAGRWIRQAIEWGGDVVRHEIRLEFILRIERAVANGTNLIEVLISMKERMAEDLLSNRRTRSTTSDFARAVEAEEVEEAARFYRTIGDWLHQYDWQD